MHNAVSKVSQHLAMIIACALFASDAVASHFEFCWLTGAVETLGKKSDGDQYFEFRVSSSEPARKGSLTTYDPEDCGRYVGTLIEANLPSSPHIAVGAELEMIQRLWIDVNGEWWNVWHSTDGWETYD